MMTPDHVAPLAVEIATAISLLEDDRHSVRLAVSEFEARFGVSRVDARHLTIEGSPASREAAMGHGAAAQATTRLLQSHPVATRMEQFVLPWFRGQMRSAPGREEDAAFAQAAAAELIRRLDHLARIERAGGLAPPFLVPAAFAVYQPMVDQLGQLWGRYVEDAFRAAAQVDPDAFREGWFDIVLHMDPPSLSAAIRSLLRSCGH